MQMSSGKQHSYYGKSQRLADLMYSLIYLPSFKTFCPKAIILITKYPTLLFIMLALKIPFENKVPTLKCVFKCTYFSKGIEHGWEI